MLVLAFVAKHGHDRLMIVFPPGHIDASGLAHAGIAAVGGNQHRRAELAPILQRNGHAMIAAFGAGHMRFPHQPDVLAGLCASVQR